MITELTLRDVGVHMALAIPSDVVIRFRRTVIRVHLHNHIRSTRLLVAVVPYFIVFLEFTIRQLLCKASVYTVTILSIVT